MAAGGGASSVQNEGIQMTESYGRLIGRQKNEMTRSMGALLGITQGLLCDGELNDKEIEYLHRWLGENEAIACTPPANIIFQRVADILEDGIVTPSERTYLSETLQRFIGGSSEDLAKPTHVMELGFDNVDRIVYTASQFCLTGEFAYAERRQCEELIETRGGIVANVTKKLNYLVVGERGSAEWKHGSFGTKIAKALDYKQRGVPILIIAENVWASNLRAH
jgi:NAD-dependent DNA ligase